MTYFAHFLHEFISYELKDNNGITHTDQSVSASYGIVCFLLFSVEVEVVRREVVRREGVRREGVNYRE